MNELRAIEIFVRVSELGSFNQVAQALGLSAQAVSKSVRQLEQHLGMRLFHRTTRSNTLTEDGQRFLDSVRPRLDALQRVLSGARQASGEEHGLIRISAATPVGRRILLPLLQKFRERYPRIEVDLVLDEKFSDQVIDRIDVGFRAGGPPEAQVITRRLFPIQDVTCAPPAYLREAGLPADLEALAAHRCTGYRSPSTGRVLPWEFKIDGMTVQRTMAPVFSANEPETEMEAVLAGFGIGQIDSINAAPRLRAGELIPLFTDWVSDRRGLYLWYANRSNMPRRVRLFIDFALERLLDSTEHTLSAQELQTLARKGLAALRRGARPT
ncbi:LysR substrate-binding domain-containing protein [Pseudomonadota bacterium AL_CKDN230030165-1A_HGKHYDSX7]